MSSEVDFNSVAALSIHVEDIDPYTGFEDILDDDCVAGSSTHVEDIDPYTGFEDILDDDCVVIEEVEDEKKEDEEEEKPEENQQPYVGMEFKSEVEAYNFYNKYGGYKGFSIRKNSRNSSSKGVTSVAYVCSKEGFSKYRKQEHMELGNSSNKKTPEKEKGSGRTGCKAYLRLKLVKDAIWQVTKFHDIHNHNLVPNTSARRRILQSQKLMTNNIKQIIRDLTDQNIEPSKILAYLSTLEGGKDNIPFKRKDVSNLIAMDNAKLLGRDVETTLMNFQRKKEEDPEFFYAIDVDEDGCLKHIFWADGRSRRAYLEFGDVVTFDTTYNTNMYSMPLAPFIGVNHHRQSIFFGMALLRSETTDNFCWLFETWLKAMYGKHPVSIITDQDHAMRNAIKIVFPNTVHRCCKWHVMRKAKEKLASLYGLKPTFKTEMELVINYSSTVSDFETRWMAMIEKHKLKDNKHLNNMYEKRSEWVPAYFRDVFFADMSTTQRSESMNALLKMWLTSHSSIYKFVMKIDGMIESIWQSESDEDLISMDKEPHLWSMYDMEDHAREVYTKRVFKEFKELLKRSTLGKAIEKERDVLYEVNIAQNPKKHIWVPESYVVSVDKEGGIFSCNCKGFEFEGLLCSHALKVMCNLGIEKLPSHYILKRWCKNANIEINRPVNERSRVAKNSQALEMFRFAALNPKLNSIGKWASKDDRAFNMVEAKLGELLSQISQLVLDDISQPAEVQTSNEKGPVNMLVVSDPPLSQCKGRKKKPARWKSAAENAPNKRICGYCKQKTFHNRRTCPKFLENREIGMDVEKTSELERANWNGEEME
ncbi:FAR1-related sequence 5 [Rhynchospora pubera]|uniref:FAR1-related sequence 5 n=1 Tax=Rhynchospora pubera TaxID=906938 RepID=A0AAV8EBF2_9POAL|nr:FAR1-related sequence 5 [Rhynchospora pubera]